MKKSALSVLFIAAAVLFNGCSGKEVRNELLTEPSYDQAEYRAEIGNLFYETDEKIGITTSFGFFLYHLEEKKLISAFDLDENKAFGEEYFTEARLSQDEKSILLTGYSHEKTFDEYHFSYDIETGNLYKVEQRLVPEDLYPLPDQNRNAFEGTSWKAEDFAYYPQDSDTPYYPFRNLN